MALQQDAAGPLVGVGVTVGPALGLAGEDGDVKHLLSPTAPWFLGLHLAVGLADDPVGGGVELPVGVELIADAAPGSEGEHGRALIAQGVGVLVTPELAPGRVELPGHAEEVERKVAGVLGRHRKVVVAPAAGGERLELKMAKIGKDVVASARDVAGVVDDRHVRAERLGRLSGEPVVLLQGQTGGFPAVILLLGVESVRLHEVEAPAPARLTLVDDVEEDAVAVGKEPHCLTDLGAEVVQIGAVEVHHVEARV